MTAPLLPDDVVVNCSVQVDQFIQPDGSVGTRVYYDGDVPRSQVVGLLCIAAMDVWKRTEDDE